MVEIEKQLYHNLLNYCKQLNYLLINTNIGNHPIAIFTSHKKAVEYALACCIKFTLEVEKEYNDPINFNEQCESVKGNLMEYYKIEPLYNYDVNLPIYNVHCPNYNDNRYAQDYLTNDLEQWKTFSRPLYGNKVNDIEWINECILKVDPVPLCQ